MGKLNQKATKGFSLAELLVVLLIIAQIATFSIPKVLQSQQDHRKKAVFRETIAALNDVVYMGTMTHDMDNLSTGTDMRNYMKAKMNYVKWCTAVISQGCTALTDRASCQESQGMVLHNGAVIYEIATVSSNAQGGRWRDVRIDYNGSAGPNIGGIDLMQVTLTFGTASEGGNRPGTVNPDSGATDISLYEEIFSK